jgi:nucleotide-binding universal stress UspA family protein
MLAIKTIVHPTDFSPTAEFARRLACSLARDYRARVILMHVRVSSPAVYGEFGSIHGDPAGVKSPSPAF